MSSARPSPLRGEHQADVVVLGASLPGLLTALELARPGRKVAVVEAASVPGSGSAADLGHVVTGLDLPYTRAVARFGREEARNLWEWQREGHERLRTRLETLHEDCGYRRQGGFVLGRDRAEALELADSEDALHEDGFGGEFLDHYMLEARFDVRRFSGAYWAADDGEVNPVALLRALAAEAVARGIALFEASPLTELGGDASGVVATTAHGRLRASIGVVACDSALSLLALSGRGLAPVPVRRLVCALEAGLSLPSPARSADGALAWCTGRDFRAAAYGSISRAGAELSGESPSGPSGPSSVVTIGKRHDDPLAEAQPAASAPGAEPAYDDLAAVLGSHLSSVPRPVGRWAGAVLAAPDAMPLIGYLPTASFVAVLGLGLRAHSWSCVGARWAAETVSRGKDAAPAAFRPARLPSLGAEPHRQ